MNDELERAVRAVVDQVEAWHDRTNHSVDGTFSTCLHDPCANVQRTADARVPADTPDGLMLEKDREPQTGSGPTLVPEVASKAGAAAEERREEARRTSQEVRERTSELLLRLPLADEQERRSIRDEVVTLHLPMAAAAARRYRTRSEADDLLQVACAGLVEAFDRFDPARASYAYFAWVTVHGLLRRHLRDHGWSVRPIRHSQEAALVLRRFEPELTQRLGRTPSEADLAASLGWSRDEVRAARRAEQGMTAASLEALGEAHVGAEEDQARAVEARAVLRGPLRDLDDDERELVRLRFGAELTQAEIARLLGVSQMQVSRALARLMGRLRSRIGDLESDEVAGAA